MLIDGLKLVKEMQTKQGVQSETKKNMIIFINIYVQWAHTSILNFTSKSVV